MGPERFDLYVARSLVPWFMAWLQDAAAELQ
jgi:sarcosine oxidase gamma subunit